MYIEPRAMRLFDESPPTPGGTPRPPGGPFFGRVVAPDW